MACIWSCPSGQTVFGFNRTFGCSKCFGCDHIVIIRYVYEMCILFEWMRSQCTRCTGTHAHTKWVFAITIPSIFKSIPFYFGRIVSAFFPSLHANHIAFREKCVSSKCLFGSHSSFGIYIIMSGKSCKISRNFESINLLWSQYAKQQNGFSKSLCIVRISFVFPSNDNSSHQIYSENKTKLNGHFAWLFMRKPVFTIWRIYIFQINYRRFIN